MEISENKRLYYYESEKKAKMIIKISLPSFDEKTEAAELYEALFEEYRKAATKCCESFSEAALYSFKVEYTSEKGRKNVKIKRLATVTCGRETLFEVADFDFIDKDSFKVKK